MSSSSSTPPWGMTRIPGSYTSSSSGMRIVARILPSGPSSACPTVPRPRIRPSVTPFCLSKLDTSTAALTEGSLASIVIGHRRRTAPPSGPLKIVVPYMGPRSEFTGGCLSRGDPPPWCAIARRWCSSSTCGGEPAVVREGAADRLEHRARLEEHLVVLGVRVRGGDDRPARPDLQAAGRRDERADHDAEIGRPVDRQESQRARVYAARAALEPVDDLHRAQLRRAAHRAAWERRADAFDRGHVVTQAAPDRRDELMDGGVRLDGHELRHL